MRLFFALIGSLGISLSVTTGNEWFYYKEYPWVYDNVTEDWLYLRGGEDGKVFAYRASTKIWEEFNVQEQEKTWDEYEVWIQNPKPYGGVAVLQLIKEAKDNNSTEINLYNKNITDASPLKFLTNLEKLSIDSNNISDISFLSNLKKLTYLELDQNQISDISVLSKLPNLTNLWIGQNNLLDFSPLSSLINLVGLSMIDCNISVLNPLTGLNNLETLYLYNNPITKSQKAMLEEALPNTTIYWPDEIIDDRTWDENYEVWIQNPEPYGGLSVLQQIKDAKDSGALDLNLVDSNITDLTPLAELNNLIELRLGGNYIADLSPLANLTNLQLLGVSDNKIFDLSPLSELTALETLHIGVNEIEDLSPLSGLKNLNQLWAYDNNITDVSSTSPLTNLILLDFRINDISASQIIMLEQALPNTQILYQ